MGFSWRLTTSRLKLLVCMGACVARKQRVETYLEPETVRKIESHDEPASEFIRTAVRERLEE